MKYKILGIFPCPVYEALRESDLDSIEVKDVEDIINDSRVGNATAVGDGGLTSFDTYIFNTKLKKIKEFCEKHIEKYVEKIISPKEELNFYITQSWLTYVKPLSRIQRHYHSNSIISGVYYISTVEDDKIYFYNMPKSNHSRIHIETKTGNPYNAECMTVPVQKNKLILFPSWLEHGVDLNESATTDRISLAFNVFARGTLGAKGTTSELIV